MRISRLILTLITVACVLVACTARQSLQVSESHTQSPPSSESVAPTSPAPSADAPAAPAQPAATPSVDQNRVVQPHGLLIKRYHPADLLTGQAAPAGMWRIARLDSGLSFAPDGKSAALYNSELISASGPPPVLVNLATGQETRLPDPNSQKPYVYISWLPDGNLLLVGQEQVWMAGTRGENLKTVATVTSSKALLSPDGSRLALWDNYRSSLYVLELKTGALHDAKGEFREGPRWEHDVFAWSPDGSQLAGTDFDAVDSGTVRTRIIDPLTGEQVRPLEGVRLEAWLADGRLLVARNTGSGQEQSLILGSAGREELLAGDHPEASPDGKFLLLSRDGQRELLEVATGRSVPLAMNPVWTDGGDLLVLAAT